MKQGPVKFQIFEQGILVDTGNGKVQAFRKDCGNPSADASSGDGGGSDHDRLTFTGCCRAQALR